MEKWNSQRDIRTVFEVYRIANAVVAQTNWTMTRKLNVDKGFDCGQERQLPTTNIGKLGESANFWVSTQIKHINGLTSGWLQKPSLPIFANRQTV